MALSFPPPDPHGPGRDPSPVLVSFCQPRTPGDRQPPCVPVDRASLSRPRSAGQRTVLLKLLFLETRETLMPFPRSPSVCPPSPLTDPLSPVTCPPSPLGSFREPLLRPSALWARLPLGSFCVSNAGFQPVRGAAGPRPLIPQPSLWLPASVLPACSPACPLQVSTGDAGTTGFHGAGAGTHQASPDQHCHAPSPSRTAAARSSRQLALPHEHSRGCTPPTNSVADSRASALGKASGQQRANR